MAMKTLDFIMKFVAGTLVFNIFYVAFQYFSRFNRLLSPFIFTIVNFKEKKILHWKSSAMKVLQNLHCRTFWRKITIIKTKLMEKNSCKFFRVL